MAGRKKLSKREILIRTIQKDLVESYGFRVPRSIRKRFERTKAIQIPPYLDGDFVKFLKLARESETGCNADFETYLRHHPLHRLIHKHGKLWKELVDRLERCLENKDIETLNRLKIDIDITRIPDHPEMIRQLAEGMASLLLPNVILSGGKEILPQLSRDFLDMARDPNSDINAGRKFVGALSCFWTHVKVGTLTIDDVEKIVSIFDEQLTEHGEPVAKKELKEIKENMWKFLTNLAIFCTNSSQRSNSTKTED